MEDKGAARRIAALWKDDLVGPTGVLQVAAVGRVDDGGLAVIRIGPASPASETDFFSLSVARARADVIITTGSILRAEPDVSHDPGPELRAWRRTILGKKEDPALAVLTRGTQLPAEHPALQGHRVILATNPNSAQKLEAALGRPGIEVLSLAECSLRGLIAEFQRRGRSALCIEAGPSATAGLYAEPLAINELMLSLYEEAPLPPELVAGRFPDQSTLRAHFGAPLQETVRTEESGRWRFQRFATP